MPIGLDLKPVVLDLSRYPGRDETIRSCAGVRSQAAAATLPRLGLPALGRVPGPWALIVVRGGRYLAIRDPTGLQPLYYARIGAHHVVVGEHLADLAADPRVDTRIDADGLALRLMQSLGCSEPHRTDFQGIRRVPAGCAVDLETGATTRYWDPGSIPIDWTLSFGDCVERFRAAIDRAVAQCLDAAEGEVSTHISGGLDSAAVAVRAGRYLQERGTGLRLATSWAPSPAERAIAANDERTLALELAQQLDLPLQWLRAEDVAEWWPTVDPHRYPASMIHEEILHFDTYRANSVKTVVSGFGGDEFLSAYGARIPQWLLAQHRWRDYWRWTRTNSAVNGSGVWRGALGPILRPMINRVRTPRRTSAGDRTLVQIAPRGASLRAQENEAARSADWHELMVHRATSARYLLRVESWHAIGGLWGIRYAFPLLHPEVIEVALSSPWWAFRHQGWNRAAFRGAIDPWLPTDLVWNGSKDEPSRWRDAESLDLLAMRLGRRPLVGSDPVAQRVARAVAIPSAPTPTPISGYPSQAIRPRPDKRIRTPQA